MLQVYCFDLGFRMSCGFGGISVNRARLCESFCSFCGEMSVGAMGFAFAEISFAV